MTQLFKWWVGALAVVLFLSFFSNGQAQPGAMGGPVGFLLPSAVQPEASDPSLEAYASTARLEPLGPAMAATVQGLVSGTAPGTSHAHPQLLAGLVSTESLFSSRRYGLSDKSIADLVGLYLGGRGLSFILEPTLNALAASLSAS